MIYDRKIGFKYPYNPLINSVELTKASCEKSFLKLSFTEKNLFDIVLDLCQFDFNFPFAIKKENVKIKNFSMGYQSGWLSKKKQMIAPWPYRTMESVYCW